MMFGGKSMGSGGGGGRGNLLRSVGRAVTKPNFANGTLQEPNISSSTSSPKQSSHSSPPRQLNNGTSSSSNGNGNLSLLSSPFASCNVPAVSSVYGCATWPNDDDGDVDWVSVDDDYFLAPVPSEDEVHNAVTALQRVFSPDSYYNMVRDKFGSEMDINEEQHKSQNPDLLHHVSPARSEIDWIEPSLCTFDSKLLQYGGSERVYDAFHLLRTEPLVQKMVKSLSSDAAVWNAVMNNEAVKELRESFSAEDGGSSGYNEGEEDFEEGTGIVKWIFDATRETIMEVVGKVAKVVSDLFQLPENEKTSTAAEDPFREKLRTSFMLSVMVLLVVVVARAHKA